MACTVAALGLLGAVLVPAGDPAAPIEYRIAIPEPAGRWLTVDVTLSDLPPAPLELRMSRASPGRYALHDFIRGVSHLQVTGDGGRPLVVSAPDAQGWTVPEHPATVHVSYRVRGDRLDGTYLAVDASHAHINMPAALVWAKGLDRRSVRVSFDPPAGSAWQAATQLLPGGTPLSFTAPNLQYLMDSPAELSVFSTRSFTLSDGSRTATFRLALHDTGTAADADAYARDLAAVTGEAHAVFGSLPAFESPEYTFIADFLPHASGDGMEHRNSSVLTSSGTIAATRADLVEKAAHEVFHAWNIERIRPRSLEPFDFERENVAGELWLGEGVTNYYGRLLTTRAGVVPVEALAAGLGNAIDTVTRSRARQHRSVIEMSRLAPQVDGAPPDRRAAVDGEFLSYYTWGETIALALDLHLRVRSNHRVTLDHLMRTLWQRFGAVNGDPGYVPRPYENIDVQDALAEVSGDVAFAQNFMNRYVFGSELPDFGLLLEPAGFTLRETRGVSRAGAPTGPPAGVLPVERTGRTLTAAQKAFRERWAGPQR
ncbi:MAG: M61 family peptidase [Vicinamibacterales bacterium]